jgi:hypothetical protein
MIDYQPAVLPANYITSSELSILPMYAALIASLMGIPMGNIAVIILSRYYHNLSAGPAVD